MTRASYRHSLLTENLANVNTPGYKRKDADFTVALDELQATHVGTNGHLTRDHKVTPETSLRVDGSNVDLEQEVYGIAETELRYSMLTQLAGDQFGLIKSAIKEGR
jgi:flagellar basal-body rod protein FlgB